MNEVLPNGLPLTDREQAVLEMSRSLETTDAEAIARRMAWRRDHVKTVLGRLRQFKLIREEVAP